MENLNDIFDQLNKASDAKHRFFKAKELQSEIHDLKTKCGSCIHWMIKSKCKWEAKGVMVSMGSSICDSFKMDKFSYDLIEQKEQEIKDLKLQ